MPTSAQQLIADFQSALVLRSTLAAAHYEADRSENQLLQHLQSASGGSFLQPANLQSDDKDLVSRASLDAHIKKVQVEQLDAASGQQLQTLQLNAQQYIGRKVQITVLSSDKQPVETIWFDERNGYRSNITKKQSYSGVIQEVLLDRNMLLIRPPTTLRLLNSSLHNYAVYIIDPETMLPMVNIDWR